MLITQEIVLNWNWDDIIEVSAQTLHCTAANMRLSSEECLHKGRGHLEDIMFKQLYHKIIFFNFCTYRAWINSVLNLLLPHSLLNKGLKNVNTFSYNTMYTHQLYRTGFLREVRKRHLAWQNSGNPAQMMCQHSCYQCTHKTVNNMAKYGHLCSSAEFFNFVTPTTYYNTSNLTQPAQRVFQMPWTKQISVTPKVSLWSINKQCGLIVMITFLHKVTTYSVTDTCTS